MVNPAIKPFVFCDEEGEAYGNFENGDHRETWPLKSKVFKNYLANLFYEKTKDIPNSHLIQDTLNVLHARASSESRIYMVFTRIAEYGEKIYLFLANEKWEVIEIDSAGSRVLSSSPVFFRKPKGMLKLPVPSTQGAISDLR